MPDTESTHKNLLQRSEGGEFAIAPAGARSGSLSASTPAAASPPARADEQPPRRRRRWRGLLLLGPLAIAVGAAYLYVTGGRYASTEDAYVKADTVLIAPEVDGRILAVGIADNAHVERGDVLFRLDPEPYRIALARAEAGLADARTAIASLKAQYGQTQDQLALAQSTEAYQQREYQRQRELAPKHMTSAQALDAARHQYDVARQQVAVLGQELAQIRAKLAGDPDIPVEQHPQYLAAKAARDQAALDLARTQVRAPMAGVVGRMPRVGDYAKTGQPLVNLVSDRDLWIEANFKETELAHMRAGQPVAITIDAYPDYEWTGHVQSLSQATGAETSILPAQNATGNWVKVVQRLAVRVVVDPQPDAPPLRAGMSTNVEVDTGWQRPLPGFLRTALAWLGHTGIEQAHAAR
jgi:membrane fusion protein (multidrug efflux system)